MAPVNDQNFGPIATIPDNLDQPPRFGALIETCKDCICLELRHFMSSSNTRLRSGASLELPRIAKYSVALDTTVDPLETAVSLIRNYPDIPEDLPLIAVLATTGQNLKLGFSDKFVSPITPSAKVVGTVDEPFNLVDGDTIQLTTEPTGMGISVASTFTFSSFMFVNIGAATAAELVNAIALQALYVKPSVSSITGHNRLALSAGGKGIGYPNKIVVTGGTAATKLGFTINQTSQNYGANKTYMERHNISASLTIGLEVVAESENVRTDISDLLFDFMAYIMADRQFTFYGRSTFDESISDETYQIIIQDSQVSLSGEQETPRQNDPKDKIYINRINVPITAILYSDRIISSNPINQIFTSNIVFPEPN